MQLTSTNRLALVSSKETAGLFLHKTLLAIAFAIASPSAPLLAATAGAQLSITPLSSAQNAPRSVVLVQNPIGFYAICSLTNQSTQIPVNVTNPVTPTVGVAATFSQDQYCDAIWTPNWGGRLITAHRFGNVRTWDATVPFMPGPLPGISLTNTNYSHEGLDSYTDSLGMTYVLYSEQHTSPNGLGGLILYQLTPTGLTYVGQNLIGGSAGSALEVSNSGSHVWQWSDRNNNQFDGVLRVYGTNGYSGNPLLLNTVPYPYTYAYVDKDLRKNASSNNLAGAMGWDGMVAVDVSSPTNPVVNTILGPSQTLFIDGVTFMPASNIAVFWGFVRIGNVDTHFIYFFDATIPGTLLPIVGFLPGFKVDDIKVLGSRFYCLGRDQTANLPILVIY